MQMFLLCVCSMCSPEGLSELLQFTSQWLYFTHHSRNFSLILPLLLANSRWDRCDAETIWGPNRANVGKGRHFCEMLKPSCCESASWETRKAPVCAENGKMCPHSFQIMLGSLSCFVSLRGSVSSELCWPLPEWVTNRQSMKTAQKERFHRKNN